MMRVVLHADLDCFYAQVEAKRLNLDCGKCPLVVQQWKSLIAVNYPARRLGITRHMGIEEAKSKCPDLIAVHTPAFKLLDTPPLSSLAGADNSGIEYVYFEPGKSPPNTHSFKVSLAGYRQASKQIFKFLHRHRANWRIEKASVDEAYIDVTEDVREHLDAEFPDWRDWRTVPEDVELNFQGRPAISDHDLDPIGIDDLYIWAGDLIANDLREALRDELGFTASVGVASNKTLAKLASPMHKPDGLTYVLPGMVSAWMHRIPFDRIRFLGGKLGQQLLQRSGANDDDNDDRDDGNENEGGNDGKLMSERRGTKRDERGEVFAADLWPLSVAELTQRLGGDGQLASWVHGIIRGVDEAPVKPRALTNSFLSAKNFRPPLKTRHQLSQWLEVLCTELQLRLQEEAMDTHRWPRSLTLIYRRLDMPASRSKAADFPFPSPSVATPRRMREYVEKRILATFSSDDRLLLPLTFVGLSLSRFKEHSGPAKETASLDVFLQAKAKDPVLPRDMQLAHDKLLFESPEPCKAKKAKRVSAGIMDKFLLPPPNNIGHKDLSEEVEGAMDRKPMLLCKMCHQSYPAEEHQEHEDYHYARQLASLE
jgi:DNA polymerase eta